MPAATQSDPIRQGTSLTLDSTLRDVLAELIVLDADHQAEDPEVIVYDTRLKLIWSDTSRVNFSLGVMSAVQGGVGIVVPPYVEVPSGDNPNNPP